MQQGLEHNLKLAAHLAPLEGVLAKVEKDLVRLNEKAASMTLGQSIGAWLDAIKGGATSTNPTPDLFDPTIRLTFSFGGFDPDGIHGATLKRLLELRNGLIHDELVGFDWESQAECARLMQDLTNARITHVDPLPLASAGFAALDLRCPIGFSRDLYID
jgi:hypothetical protein